MVNPYFDNSQAAKDLSEVTAPPDDFDHERANIEHGSMETITYPSKTVGNERQAMVYKPPGYTESKKYNVLYLLHGIGGDELEWFNNGTPNIILDNLNADDKLSDMIVVLPNGRAMLNDRAEGDIFSADKVAAFTTFTNDLLDDLIPFVEAKYSVLTERENRAIAGLSMGGGQSLNIGLHHLNQFSWIGAFSPAPNTLEPAQLLPNPKEASQHLNLLWISCGDADDLLYVSERTESYLSANQVPHIWLKETGDHDWNVWKNGLYQFAQRIFDTPS